MDEIPVLESSQTVSRKVKLFKKHTKKKKLLILLIQYLFRADLCLRKNFIKITFVRDTFSLP